MIQHKTDWVSSLKGHLISDIEKLINGISNSEQEGDGKQQSHQLNLEKIGFDLLSLEEVIIPVIMPDALYKQHPCTKLEKDVALQNARIFHDSTAVRENPHD
eukprot:5801624-Ditylum_brightwellii.AAC.1